MKMKVEHFDVLRKGIESVLSERPELTEEYELGYFPRSSKVKDLQERFCFDLLYIADLGKQWWDAIYGYCNDEQIYTALKHVCPKVERKY